MPETGFSPGHPLRMPMTCPKTLKKSSGLGLLVGESLSLKRKKSGMSTISLALLDRTIPITSGGNLSSRKEIMEPHWMFAITIISWYVLGVILVKMPKEILLKYITFLKHNFHGVPMNMLGGYKDKKFVALWMTCWLSILTNMMQQWEQSKVNKTALIKKQKSILPTWDLHSPEADLEEKKSIVGCTWNVNPCLKCQLRINPLPYDCDSIYIPDIGWYYE